MFFFSFLASAVTGINKASKPEVAQKICCMGFLVDTTFDFVFSLHSVAKTETQLLRKVRNLVANSLMWTVFTFYSL